jgi:hypothetical protein
VVGQRKGPSGTNAPPVHGIKKCLGTTGPWVQEWIVKSNSNWYTIQADPAPIAFEFGSIAILVIYFYTILALIAIYSRGGLFKAGLALTLG